MTKRRLVTLLAGMALTLSMASAVAAQEESPAPAFDPTSIPEVNQDEALIAYLAMEEELAAGGVTEEDMAAATEWLAGEAANVSQAQYDELLAAKMLRDSEAVGDDEFGQAEEDEPELFDDEDEEDDG